MYSLTAIPFIKSLTKHLFLPSNFISVNLITVSFVLTYIPVLSIFKILMFTRKIQIKKRGQITSSMLSRHRQTPHLLKRVKVHAEQREQSLSFL